MGIDRILYEGSNLLADGNSILAEGSNFFPISAGVIVGGVVGYLGIKYVASLIRKRIDKDTYRELKSSDEIILDRDIMDIQSSKMREYKFDPTYRHNIIGLEPILQRADEHIALLNNYTSQDDNIDLPRGVMFVGPPGVGKTMISRYIFSKVQGKVLELTKSEMSGFQNIRRAFEVAREKRDKSNRPVVLFRDEARSDYGRDALDLLEELSGINSSSNKGIYFVCTTNQQLFKDPNNKGQNSNPTNLADRNAAIYRPGRLEIIDISPPNLEAKSRIFELFLNREGIRYEGNPEDIASMVPYFQTGAFIENTVNETIRSKKAQRLIRGEPDDIQVISDHDLLLTLNSLLTGNRQDTMLNEKQRIRVAKHELGHLLVGKELGYRMAFVSVETHSGMGGYTHLSPHESDILATEQDLENRMKIFMGGYVAEQMFYNDGISLGSLDDLKQINLINRYLTAVRKREIDPNFLFNLNEYGGVARNDTPKDMLNKLESDSRGIIDKHRDKMDMLAKLVVDNGIVHISEIEKHL